MFLFYITIFGMFYCLPGCFFRNVKNIVVRGTVYIVPGRLVNSILGDFLVLLFLVREISAFYIVDIVADCVRDILAEGAVCA